MVQSGSFLSYNLKESFMRTLSALLASAALLAATPAFAQPTEGEEAADEAAPADESGDAEASTTDVETPPADGGDGGAAPAAPAPAPSAEPTGSRVDDVRFRGGIALGGGGLLGSMSSGFDSPLGSFDASAGVSGGIVGVDGHIGVQINDLVGVYFDPHLGFGSLGFDTSTGTQSEGWLAMSATMLVDFTFIDQIFVGAGGGVSAQGATCTNCELWAGGVAHLQVGRYPLMSFSEEGSGRQGLMVAADVRLNFLSPTTTLPPGATSSLFLAQPMLTIGYEAY